MSSRAGKSIAVYLGLFALLRLGWGQEIAGIAHAKSDIATGRPPAQASPEAAVPLCGKSKSRQEPFVITENTTAIGDLPWRASIYIETATANGTEKIFACNGTIIQDNLVLTAARCVYHGRTRRPVDSRKLFVMMGNVIRDYDSPLHDPVTVGRGMVKNLHRDCLYEGFPGESRLALLELQEPFHISEIISPGCLNIGSISDGSKTAESAGSSDIPMSSMDLVSSCQCELFDAVRYGVETTDRFCVAYTRGPAVCQHESFSSGLSFYNGVPSLVMGFVRVDLETNLEYGRFTCDKYPYSIHLSLSS